MKFSIFITLALAITAVKSDTHVVLVAGSNGFYNYRHQTDACHAYQIAVSGGIPAENVILFSYDDVASSSQNPFPGKLFNKPDGSDVYTGCVIDYRKGDVTPKNYLSVLIGDADAMKGKGTGRVLTSTEGDNVFLNFADHGAPGLIAFPSSYLYATDLLRTLTNMHKQKMYKNLIYYLEACESGSMFTHLPTDINIYAVTAANDHESSWGYYCPPDDHVQGTHIGSCLGDLFSIAWMEDTDASDTKTETIGQQVDKVTVRTSKSHVTQFGTTTFRDFKVSDFVGVHNAKIVNPGEEEIDMAKAVDSRDIKLQYLIHKHAREMTNDSMADLNQEILERKLFDDIFEKIRVLHADVSRADDTDFDCYKTMINFFEGQCGKFSEYGMKYMRSLYDICAKKQEVIGDVKTVIADSCPEGKLF